MVEKAEAERCKLQEELARQQAEAQRELAASQVRGCSVQLVRPFTSTYVCSDKLVKLFVNAVDVVYVQYMVRQYA